MYNIISTSSLIIRQLFLPNPFENLSQYYTIVIFGVDYALFPVLINLIVEPILFIITRFIVRIYYEPRSNPPLGSFLYLLFYMIHVGLIFLAGLFGFTAWAFIIIVVFYIASHIGFHELHEKFSYWIW